MPAIEGLSEGRIGYLCSGHVQDVPVHYSTVPDSSNVLNTGTQPFLCRPNRRQGRLPQALNRGHGPLQQASPSV